MPLTYNKTCSWKYIYNNRNRASKHAFSNAKKCISLRPSKYEKLIPTRIVKLNSEKNKYVCFLLCFNSDVKHRIWLPLMQFSIQSA